MLKTIKARLTLIFLVLLLVFCIVFSFYLWSESTKDSLDTINRTLFEVNSSIKNATQQTSNFLLFDSNDNDFLKKGKSKYINEYKSNIEKLTQNLIQLRSFPELQEKQTVILINTVNNEIVNHQVLFDSLIIVIKYPQPNTPEITKNLTNELENTSLKIEKALIQTNNKIRENQNKTQKRIFYILLFLFIYAIIVNISMIYFVNQRFGTPLYELSNAIHRITNSNFTTRRAVPQYYSQDEIGILSADINDLLAKMYDKNTEVLERNEELNQQKEEILYINQQLENQKEELQQAFSDIKLLSKIGIEITKNLTIADIQETIIRNIGGLMDVTIFGLGIYIPEKQKILFSKTIEKGKILPDFFDDLNSEEIPLSVQCFKNQKEIHINEFKTEYGKYYKQHSSTLHGENSESIVYIPLTTTKKQIGVITIQSFKPFAYNELDLNLLRSLASYISIAVENASAFEEIQKQNYEIEQKSKELENANIKISKNLQEIEIQKLELTELANQLQASFMELEESGKRLANIIDFIPDPLIVIDDDGQVMAWNKSMEKLTGVEAERIIGKQNFSHGLALTGERKPLLADYVVHPELLYVYDNINFNVSDNTYIEEIFVEKMNIYLWNTATALYNSNNVKTGAIQVSRDITERIIAQREISKAYSEIEKQNAEITEKNKDLSELIEEVKTNAIVIEEYNRELEKLSIVASKTENAVLIADADGTLEWVNESFSKLYGYTLEEYINEKGKTLYETSTNENFNEFLSDSIREKRSAVYMSKNLRKDGNTVWIQTNLTPIFDINENLSKIIIVDTDITKIIEAEQELANQTKKITYSIKYARRIQSALLPPNRFLDRTLPEYFILYKPKDIVSGDFYWVTRKQTKIIFAVADCTGHGVPGAFMSILGISFLNEITNKLHEKNHMNDIQPGEILDLLRENIIKTLHQKGKEGEQKDGMDIALCVYDIDTRKLISAGANNPVYIITKCENTNKTEHVNNCTEMYSPDFNFVLHEIKPDKMPIGINVVKTNGKFTNKEIHLKTGDCVYLFSDGYADQFGGPAGRKFLSKSLKNIFLQIHFKAMNQQKEILDNTIEEWKNTPNSNGKTFSQMDDILIMGIRF